MSDFSRTTHASPKPNTVGPCRARNLRQSSNWNPVLETRFHKFLLDQYHENFPRRDWFGVPSRFAWYNLYVYCTARMSARFLKWTGLNGDTFMTFKKCVKIIKVYLFSVEGMIFCVFTKWCYAVHSSGNREGFKYLNRTPFCGAPVQNLNKEKEFVLKFQTLIQVLQV